MQDSNSHGMQRDHPDDRTLSMLRRNVLACVGVLGLGPMSSTSVGAAEDGNESDSGNEPFAPKEHDHSGEHDVASRLGEAAPVESITVEELYTKSAPVIDVTAYGARGDGETDDYEAIQQAFDAAGQRAVIYFPPGHYRSSDAITASDKSLVIMGDGMGTTRIEFTGGTDGFDLSLPSTDESGIEEESYVTVKDLTLGASVSGSGTAISAVWDKPPSGAIPHLVVENVNIRDPGSAADDAGHFLKGVYADNAWRARVKNFHYSGYVHDIPLGDEDDIDEFEPEMIGIELVGRTVDSSVTGCHLSRCDVGIKVGEDGRRNTEGVRIHEATMVDCYRGVVAKSGPWLTVTSSHFNGRRTAVELDNRWEANVSDCLFYKVPWSRTDEWEGVHAADASNIQVSNVNVGDLAKNGSLSRGVFLENCSECVVQGNTVNGLESEDNAVVEATDSTRIMASGNVARDMPTVVKFGESTTLNSAQGNWGRIRDEGRLNLVENNLAIATLAAQQNHNNVPEGVFADEEDRGLGEDETYGQTFTVDQGFDLIETFVANFRNDDSAATMTLFRGDPSADGANLEAIASTRREEWPNMATISWDFEADEPGTYYLEMSNPDVTPTWWWYDAEDDRDDDSDEKHLEDVGGTAFVNREPVDSANFRFRVLGIVE